MPPVHQPNRGELTERLIRILFLTTKAKLEKSSSQSTHYWTGPLFIETHHSILLLNCSCYGKRNCRCSAISLNSVA